MKNALPILGLLCTVLLTAGCTPTCQGDSCSRPQSNAAEMVIWWPEHMRAESGPSNSRADYQSISLER
ncbi:HrpT family type III secretion system protein [Pseudomonas mucidolens]|uniref:HrpT family type III secretion system protein n=1 Tax=Pseudomonas mucidolens TaxID=46679 RepID=UPI0030D74B6C